MSLVFNYDKDLPKVTNARLEYLRAQVILLKNIFQPEQKTKEWYEMRETLLTASDWGTVLGENHYLDHFPMLKDREKRIDQDAIWKKICAELNWEFIPTI